MIDYINPFEYEEANKFSIDEILAYYIEDHNYSRFLRSRRNIFLLGERGAGKTMALLYNSFPVRQKDMLLKGLERNYDLVSVYVPCKTTLTYKTEHELLDQFRASIISEHFFVLSIMYSISDTLSGIDDLTEAEENDQIVNELKYLLDIDIPTDRPLFESLKSIFDKEVIEAQNAINSLNPEAFYDRARSFSSGVAPFVTCIRQIEKLNNSHFAIMLDDAHDLNEHQIKSLNSWIAYRDNTYFSYKVATTKVNKPPLITASGGSILEGHDFTMIDMEKPYQNKDSDFAKLANDIISKRLNKIRIEDPPAQFFPINRKFQTDLEKCKDAIAKEAREKFPSGTKKQINDYIYKYTRVAYFRERSSKANLPPYSGFEVITHLSTGVIRNLLEPCYWMYDKLVSESRRKQIDMSKIKQIPPSIQTQIILDRSHRKWEWIKDGLDNCVEGCSREQSKHIYQLFDNLAIYFRERLLHAKSEPRAIKFMISNQHFVQYNDLLDLLVIARKAQLLYTYLSSGKELGRRETYYVPNRMLWPSRGLDPVGQYAASSIKASDLWNAAVKNVKIPFTPDKEDINYQQVLFQ